MKSHLIILLFFVFCLGCAEKKQETVKVENDGSNSKSTVIPTNQINAWANNCGFTFEFHGNTGEIWALDFIKKSISYSILNDSLFVVTYPKEPVIFSNIQIDNNKELPCIKFKNTDLSNSLVKNKKEIIFGPDILKYQMISKNAIKVFFPKKSYWHISRVSDYEIKISNGKTSQFYHEFAGM